MGGARAGGRRSRGGEEGGRGGGREGETFHARCVLMKLVAVSCLQGIEIHQVRAILRPILVLSP